MAMAHLLAGDDHSDGGQGPTATGRLKSEDETVVTTTSTVTKNTERAKTAILVLAKLAATGSERIGGPHRFLTSRLCRVCVLRCLSEESKMKIIDGPLRVADTLIPSLIFVLATRRGVGHR